MKVLLIYPHYSKTTNTFFRFLKNKIPPLGLLYIGSALKEKSHEVKIIDAEEKKIDLESLGKLTKNYNPQIIGISTTTPVFKRARETATYLKKILPNVPIIFGGPHLASFPKISLEFKEIDYGIIGEGEITICELVDAIEKKQDPGKIKGIVFRKNNEIIQTESREMIQDLNKISLPAWSLIDIRKYQDIMSKRDAFATMISSRGCPYNCFWCDPEGRFGKKFRARSADNMIKEIDLLYNKYGIREILFYDDTFTVDRQRVIDFCNTIIKQKFDLIWECRTRVNLVDEKLIKLMAKAGCYRIRFGIESGNEKILKFIRKGITKEQARNAIGWCKKYKIEIFTYFMLGLPTETEKTMKETIKFAIELNPDYTTFSPTIAFNRGNDLFKWAAEKGFIEKDYWERFVRGENISPYPQLKTDKLKEDTVRSYSKMAYRKFYLRPSFVLKKLSNYRNIKNLKKYLLIGIAFLFGKIEA
ncbi:B12-binding domain-containing radical SAM protein [Patescibacteria group bacterium]|nr:B12-binding domain-containing radical SAM protein [Patescibacteria group bacterium]